jgi:putative membrane-bound dehydrogenase-like protein
LLARAAEPIRPATDAPKPLTPEQSRERFRVPDGFRVELVASEPLIREPSGVCWDERGRLFVCELHGYNLEGHLDVRELNKTGVLDREVRRIPANKQAQAEALQDTYGTVKLLADSDGDGRMDTASVFADRLPPCYGLVPARGGVIVACAPDIVFLADRDGDGRAEVRETLFTGFKTGVLERGINAPQWGFDDWIYFGRGHGGGRITGPRLREPVQLGGTDFRIKADGSAIEPVTGATHTFGFAFTEEGDRFTITTSVPGIFVAPLPWRHLARNTDAAGPRLEQNAADYTRVFPIAPPHPWRVKRAEDPGFFKFYRDRYGASDSDAGGFFTSACSPLVYQDVALPAECRGQYFVCEPAQNLVHRAVIERDGPALRLRRAPGEEQREFLASSDPWFHPMNLAHGPEGALYIVDFYREIIEDYSAIPRYLQQQYGLVEGREHGRVWRLTHRSAPRAPAADMSRLGRSALVKEVASPHFWRRQTARRLLVERGEKSAVPALSRLARSAKESAGAVNALHTLDALGGLTAADAIVALQHPEVKMRRHALPLTERWINDDGRAGDRLRSLLLPLAREPAMQIPLALALGERRGTNAIGALADCARSFGDTRWAAHAILTGLHGRGGLMLGELLGPGRVPGRAEPLLEPLCQSIAARRDAAELAQALALVAGVENPGLRTNCLRGLQAGLKSARNLPLPTEGRQALDRLLADGNAAQRRLSENIAASFVEADAGRVKRLVEQIARDAADFKLPPQQRLDAVTRLAALDGVAAAEALLAAWNGNTPQVQAAIVEALFARRERLPSLLTGIEAKTFPANALTAVQRATLLESPEPAVRERAARLLNRPAGAGDEVFRKFAAALPGPRDAANGERVFREHCATCHRARGQGFAVGPDLDAEFQRAEEAILKDILAPGDALTAGYATCVIETTAGQTHSGILAGESATSLTLKLPAGAEVTVLRKDIARLTTLGASLMPEALRDNLTPRDAADVITWLRGAGVPAK